MSQDYLFNSSEWFSVSAAQKKAMEEEIAGMSGDRILRTPVEDLATYCEDRYSLEAPTLIREKITASQKEVDIDISRDRDRYWGSRGPGPHYVRGTQVTFSVPFTGDGGLFKVQPTTFTTCPPMATVKGSTLYVIISGTKLEPQSLRAEFDREIDSIDKYLTFLRSDVGGFNSGLKLHASNLIEKRRKKLLEDQNLVANLGFPLKVREGSPTTYAAPEVRKRVNPSLPPQSKSTFKPEPVLDESLYEHVLSVLQNMVQVFERSPSAFREMDEETLRTHFLVQLNGHFEGKATAETFNASGKTDILLRVDGRNIFIGECKIWGGSKKLVETVDQLLSYSSWRDTKVAVMLFNRRKNFSAVLSEIPNTMEKHPNFKRKLQSKHETQFRYVFSQPTDPAREMFVTVLAFDVPAED